MNHLSFWRTLKNSVGLSLCCLLILSLFSCDPGQVLRIENKTDAPATVTFVFNPGSNHEAFEKPVNSDTLIIALDNTPENSTQEYFFGLGTWKVQGSMDSLVSMIDMIQITTKESKDTYKGEQPVRNFLESKVGGSMSEMIEIVLE